jgi:hypothetical protein
LVDVDENGTVAAAATAVNTGVVYLPVVPVFRADHPFIFMIRDTRSGSILFLGRVVDPTAAGGSAASSKARFQPASFGGIFYDTNGPAFQSSGSWNCSRGVTGRLTGTIELTGRTYRFAGQLYPGATSATLTIGRPPLSDLAVTLQFPDPGGLVSGIVSDGSWTAELLGTQTTGAYTAAHPAPQAGSYTMTLLGASDGTMSPGYGSYGTVTVAPNGRVHLTGRLSDGTAISQSAGISTNGGWPLYVSLYGGKGSLLGWISFTNQPASRFNGTATWTKTAARGSWYANGFTNLVTALGSILQH